MAHEHPIQRYRNWYAKLLRFYPGQYRERFGQGMEQTFSDLLRERRGEDDRLFGRALWMFAETSVGIIKENITFTIMQNKNIIRIALGTAFLLLIPLVARWPWTLVDFVVMGVLIFGTGLAYELASRKIKDPTRRAVLGIALLLAFLLVWAELAVGVFGSPFAGS